ncbi:hypothetical protein [Cryobacterium mannosilyticum]|uniref:Uncharacterized protein n=1 Tax=Cryobacterium mannosilyticum TaxID=1259190 RepID=A0A4R8W847_9MICO|nr:hypothetical protein [Cryobacterium mannosilyticum]TFC04604.1 hypothetical protein E3O32_07770 [Cryobacterium mannosilyticum]
MTAGVRALQIVDYDFDVPSNFYTVPLDPAESVDSTRWAESVVADVAQRDPNPGTTGDFAAELAELRTRLLGQRNPWLTAAVSVRPEKQLTIGAVLTVQQLAMDDDDGPAAYERIAREESTRMRPGARSRDLELWRADIPAGEVVGLFQRIEFTELGAAEGRLSERTVFAVFPVGSSEMLQFAFTCDDFGAFASMREETQAIVETLHIVTEAL